MNKPGSLRKHFLRLKPELKHNLNRLMVFIDNSTLRSTMAQGLLFEYSYTLNIILTDYAGHPDAVAIPCSPGVQVNQRKLMRNLVSGKETIGFEADVLDNSKVDLSIKLPLTERVVAKTLEDGSLSVDHPTEPAVDLEPFTLRSLSCIRRVSCWRRGMGYEG